MYVCNGTDCAAHICSAAHYPFCTSLAHKRCRVVYRLRQYLRATNCEKLSDTDSASSYRAVKGYVHEFVNHTQKEYARGDVHEHRAECLFSLLKPYLRVFRGLSKFNLPGYVGFLQFLRNFHQQNACEQAELILRAALDPTIASRARRGEFVKCLDHFDLLQTARN